MLGFSMCRILRFSWIFLSIWLVTPENLSKTIFVDWAWVLAEVTKERSLLIKKPSHKIWIFCQNLTQLQKKYILQQNIKVNFFCKIMVCWQAALAASKSISQTKKTILWRVVNITFFNRIKILILFLKPTTTGWTK